METIEEICFAFITSAIFWLYLKLFFLFYSSAQNDQGENRFGHYGGYAAWPFQAIGIVSVTVAISLVIVGALAPGLYEDFGQGGETSGELQDATEGETEEGKSYTELSDKIASEMTWTPKKRER